jgi:hypothetical protein
MCTNLLLNSFCTGITGFFPNGFETLPLDFPNDFLKKVALFLKKILDFLNCRGALKEVFGTCLGSIWEVFRTI